jgi:hypothetical protein
LQRNHNGDALENLDFKCIKPDFLGFPAGTAAFNLQLCLGVVVVFAVVLVQMVT